METTYPPRFRTDSPDPQTIDSGSTLNCPMGALVSATAQNLLTSTAWPGAKVVVYIPFVTNRPFTVRSIAWMNGTTPSGNIEVGVYNSAGTRLVTSTSTAAGTTVTLQSVQPSAVTLPGNAQYYFGVTCSATSYTLGMISAAPAAGTCGSLGFMTETTSVFGLTDPWGTVAVLTASETLPHVAISRSTTI